MGNPKFKLVYIEWEDSFGCSSSWQQITNVNPAPMICKSVGWLVVETKEAKVIVPHITESDSLSNPQGCGDMTIPVSAIRRMKEIRLR